ncbi:hypothetical protein LguiB_015752 [Lonicera macranthoides]
MEDRSAYVEKWLASIPDDVDGVEESSSSKRNVPPTDCPLQIPRFSSIPPADCTLKIRRFSLILQTLQSLSATFETGGYKWRLVLYPTGDKRRNVSGYLSVYLVALVDTDTLASGWEVDVNFKLFIYQQHHIHDEQYTTFQDVEGKVAHFDQEKTENGFPKLISLAIFNDASNGYLVDDSCVIGAEVVVIKTNSTFRRKVETLSTIRHMGGGFIYWKVPNFSKLNQECYHSPVFCASGKKWMLELFPGVGNFLSLNLFLVRPETYVNRNFVQRFWKRRAKIVPVEAGFRACFGAESEGMWGFGFAKFISLDELKDESKGYMSYDTLKVYVAFDVGHELLSPRAL